MACSRQRPFLPELVHALRRSLERADVVPTGEQGRRWRELLDKVGVQLQVPGLPVRLELDLPVEPEPQPPSAAPIGAVEDLLHGAAALVRRRGGAGLAVFLDELHAAGSEELAVWLNAVQNLDGRREENPLAVVTAGLPVTPEAIMRAATFGERSAFVALDLLAEADAREALVLPAQGLGVTWTDAALRLVLAESHGHPYFLQLLGSSTWAAAAPEEGGRLTVRAVRDGVPAARGQIDAMHRARWNVATKGEQAFLRAMAQAQGPSGNVTRAAIAEGLGTRSSAISVPRERLIEKGVIEPVGHGLVRFTLPGFRDWLLAED